MGLVELVVSIKGVGLHQAHIAGKISLWMLPPHDCASNGTPPPVGPDRQTAVIANIGPYPAGDSLQLRQHGHRRVIGMDAFRAHDMSADSLNNWGERHHAGPDPIRQGRDIDLDPLVLLWRFNG